jgi:hypothetical protein
MHDIRKSSKEFIDPLPKRKPDNFFAWTPISRIAMYWLLIRAGFLPIEVVISRAIHELLLGAFNE